jgi:hypothetical protein
MSIVDLGSWRYEDDVFTNSFQPSRSDPLHHSHDDFQPFPRRFDTYSFEHLDLFYEENFLPPLCSDFSEHSYEGMIHLGSQESNNEYSQPSFYSSCYFTEDMTGIIFLIMTYLWGKVIFNLWFVAGILIFNHT